ncbi:MAG: MFS transporter [Actinobacteria bacterium]|nr:MFS transporter [Actinomycetota bacterium]MBI3686770.1 MFS transporter [Actinomycetota bacterium]
MSNPSIGIERQPVMPAGKTGPYPRRWLMLPALLAAMFMAQFDLFVVNVAAPSLQSDLHASQAALQLIVGGYAFTYASGLVTGGRLGDLFGHRRLFLAGTLAFTAASVLCALAQSPGELVTARLLQGLTGAAMVPQVLAVITAEFPVQERPKALSWFGVTMGIGAVAGQVLGGALLGLNLFDLGWRVIFLVNVPIGILSLVAAKWLLPEGVSATRPKLDPLGVIGISGGLGLALVPLVLGRTVGWPVWTWISLAAAGPVLVLTLLWERALIGRGGQPLLNLDLFRTRTFNRGLLVNVGAFASFHSFMFTLTLVLQDGIHLTPLEAGLTFCPLGVGFAAASITAQRLVSRYGGLVIAAGMLIAGTGLLSLLVVLQLSGTDTTALRVVAPITVVGIGNGLAVPALIGAVLAGVRPQQAGGAAGILTTSQQFASAIGIAVLGTVFFAALGGRTDTAGFASALQWEASFSFALALVAAAVSTRLPRPSRSAVRVAASTTAPEPAAQPSLEAPGR